MKRNLIIATSIILVVVIGFVVYNSFNKGEINYINDKQLETKFNDQETFVLVVGESTCLGCKEYSENTLVKFMGDNEDYPLYLLYTDEVFATRTQKIEFFEKFELPYEVSPTTYYIKDGKVVARYENYMPLKDKTKYDLYDFIEENE